MKIASFFIDAQKGFTPLCPNELPVNEGHLIGGELIKMGLKALIHVASKDCHPTNAVWLAQTPDQILTPVKDGGPNVDVHWPAHCMVGTKGNEFLDDLPKVTDYDFVVFKGIEPDLHPYGACYHDLQEKISTGVIEFLWEKAVDTVFVAGLATDYCVATTAIQLAKEGFKVYVPLSACRGVAESTVNEAIKKMTDAGVKVVDRVEDLP
jgi:nicotinamidase/pyrazinamidase